MSDVLVTVEQAAQRLKLHPRTVLRYIRDGRLPATRIGKSYRIEQSKLDGFAGVETGLAGASGKLRATCVVDIAGMTAADADRLASFLNAAAVGRNAQTPPLSVSTTYDVPTRGMKVILVGGPADVARLLELLQVQSGQPR